MPGGIHLVLPGLFDLPLEEIESRRLERDLPHLNHLLRYATTRGNQCFSIDAILQRILTAGEQPSTNRGLALAQAAGALPDAPGSRLLLFQAVHLQAGLHNALLVPIEKTNKNLEDINLIINDLSDLFKVDCDINAVIPGTYLMRLNAFDAPLHHPHILSVLGKAANPYIAKSRDNLRWYKLLNEMQMFMYQHEINQARGAQGLLPINSLWCWGAGDPPPANAKFAWYCDDELLRRFAQNLGMPVAALGDIEAAPARQDSLVVDLRLLEMLKNGDSSELDAVLSEIDTRLIGPLRQHARRARARLRLQAGFDLDFDLGPNAGLRFWRRTRTLADFVQPGHGA